MMRKTLVLLWKALRGLFLAAVCVELLAFVLVTTLNFVLYGNLREGPRASYDPYALFLMDPGFAPVVGAKVSDVPGMTRVVWMFGGSTLRASDAPFESSIPSKLALDFNQRLNPYSFALFNFGTNSFNSLLEIKYYQKLLIEWPTRPDLVVFYDGINDVNLFQLYRTPDAHEGYFRVKGLIESYQKSLFGLLKPVNAAWYASFTKEILDKFRFATTEVDPASPEVGEFLDAMEKRYDHARVVGQAYGSKLLVALQPVYWAEECEPADPGLAAREKSLYLGEKRFPALRRNYRTLYGLLRARLASKDYFVDLSDCLCPRVSQAYTEDGVHNTDEARSAVARALAKPMLDRLNLDTPGR